MVRLTNQFKRRINLIMERVSNPAEFYYNNEKIEGTLFTYYGDGVVEKSNSFMFLFNGINLHISLNENQQYYNVAPLHCGIIDNLGLEVYEKYKQYLSAIRKIESNYIVLNNRIFSYKESEVSSSPLYYVLTFEMKDGTVLDGTYNFTQISEHGDKVRLFKNLQSQVTYYYNQNKIEPKEYQLLDNKTREYQEIKNKIKEIHDSL